MFFSAKKLAVVATAAQGILASTLPLNVEPKTQCSNPRIRKEWRTLSTSEQNDYINAIQCLKAAPSKGKEFFDTLETRYEDFVALHINATRGGQDAPSLVTPDETAANTTGPPVSIYGVHGVGVFLPWHRYAIWTFENVLRSECNYTGAQPYWDWTLDSPASNSSLLKSPVIESFGGDGSAPTNCVETGPFTGNESLAIGPLESLKRNPRCLTRTIDESTFNFSSNWDDVYPPAMSAKSHVQFQAFIDALDFIDPEDRIDSGALISAHSLGHAVIGGDLQDVYSSPNDPLFWVHHTLLDYIWAKWQEADRSRLADIGGPRTTEGSGPSSSDQVETTTLDTPVWMGFMNDDVAVREVMDISNRDNQGVLCYKYEDSPSLEGKPGL